MTGPDTAREQQLPRLSYTIPQLVIATGLTRTRIYAMIKTGELPSFAIGRQRLVRHEAVEKVLREAERGGQAGRHGKAIA